MTVLAPEFLQTTEYSAQRMRAMMAASGIIQEGILNFGDFKVSQRALGANMSVDVAAGDAWVTGDNIARQGAYHVGNDAVVNVAVSPSHATLPRIDQIVLRIYDKTVIGGENDKAVLESISGTATAGATLSNLTGKAALPSSALLLAYVLVPAASTKVETANIGGLVDPRRGLTGYPAATAPLALAGAPPQYAMGRPAGYVPMVRVRHNVNQTPGANVAVAFNVEEFDTDGMHDLVTNTGRLTAQTPGLYSVVGSAALAAAGEQLQIGLNGAAAANARTVIAQSGLSGVTIASDLRLGFGDFVNLFLPAATQVSSIESWSPTFAAVWKGP